MSKTIDLCCVEAQEIQEVNWYICTERRQMSKTIDLCCVEGQEIQGR